MPTPTSPNSNSSVSWKWLAGVASIPLIGAHFTLLIWLGARVVENTTSISQHQELGHEAVRVRFSSFDRRIERLETSVEKQLELLMQIRKEIDK